jgi:hypothetical protein
MLAFLELLCLTPSKNPLLKPYDGTFGVFVTRFGLVRVLEDGSVVSLTFIAGKIVGMEEGKLIYEDSMFSFCRKTRLYVLPCVWKPYCPVFDKSGNPKLLPFFSPEVEGKLLLVKTKDSYIIVDKNQKEYAFCFKEGIALMKVGTKLVPLFDGCKKSLAKQLKLEEKAINLDLKKELKDLSSKEKKIAREENSEEKKIAREEKKIARQEANKKALTKTLNSIKAISNSYNKL